MCLRAVTRGVRHVRFNPAEWAAVEAAAEQKQIPPSTYVREASVRVARRSIGRGGDQQTQAPERADL